jgi:photosystem II stability/assembly factor-like uncharacterized protein
MRNCLRIMIIAASGVLFNLSGVMAINLMTNDIPGGWVRRAVEAPSSPGTYYAASWGVFKSTDFGYSWKSKPYPLPTTVDGSHFPRHNTLDIAVCPHDPNLIITGDQNETPIWRSTDSAGSWASVLLENDSQRRMVNMVSFSITNTSACFAAGRVSEVTSDRNDQWFYISADKGATWTRSSLNVSGSQTIMHAIQAPIGPSGRILVAVVDKYYGFIGDGTAPVTGSIRYSDNNGATFSSASLAWAPYNITWDPANSRLWAVSAAGAIYSSADGISWTFEKQMIAPSGTMNGPMFLYKIKYTVCGGTPMLFTAANGYGDAGQMVYRNSAAGFPAGSWHASDYAHGTGQKLNGIIYDVIADTRDATGNSWGVGIANSGFFTTTDDGAHVTQSSGINTRSVTYGVRHGDQIVINTFGNMSYGSNDGGATWSQVHPALDSYGGGVSDKYFAINPVDPTKVYMTGDYSFYLSTTGGMGSFNRLTISAPIYPFVAGGSTDLFPVYSNILIHPSTPTVMFMGVKTGSGYALDSYLLKSVDSGLTWAKVTGLVSHGIASIAFDPLNPDIIYASCGAACKIGGQGVKDGLWMTADGGATWKQIGKDIFELGYIETFAFDTDNPGTLWTAGNYADNLQNGGVFVTKDGGAHWKRQLMNGRSISNPRIFYFKPYLYFGTVEGFLYKSDDRGQSWGIAMMFPSEISWLINDSTTTASTALRRAPSQNGSLYSGGGSGLYLVSNLGPAGGILGGYGDPINNRGGFGDVTDAGAYAGAEIKTYNYPNPFNPTLGLTTIKFSLPRAAATVKARVYSLAGELVVDGDFAGLSGSNSFTFTWNGRNLNGEPCAPGLYFLIIDADGAKAKNKIVLLY